MKFTIAAATILSILSPLASAATGSAAWDTVYDSASTSTLSLACSDGVYGLYSKYPTLGSVPKFPMVGAAPTIPGWNSPNCGKCFSISATVGGTARTIYIIGVDTSRSTTDFVLSQSALNTLTGGNAVALGRVPVTWSQLASGKNCGLPA